MPVKQQQQIGSVPMTQSNQSNTPQTLLLTSKSIDARRWSFASMHSSSSGYSGGTNTPPPPPPPQPVKCEEPFRSSSLSSSSTQSACLGYDDSNISDHFSHYSSDEKLILHGKNADETRPYFSQHSSGFDSGQESNGMVHLPPPPPPQNRQSLCGNSNCPNCNSGASLAASINLECMGKSIEQPAPPFIFMDTRSRICSSSNDSSQLDESYEGGRSSPITFQRQRARSLRLLSFNSLIKLIFYSKNNNSQNIFINNLFQN